MDTSKSDVKRIFERQAYHLAALIILMSILFYSDEIVSYQEGEFLGLSSGIWFWASIFAAILHQAYAWLFWRLELYLGYLTKKFGKHSFTVFKVLFAFFGLSRLLIFPMAYSNRHTLELPALFQWGLSSILLLLSGYLFYSVIRWFGINRAAGLDHFKPDEAKEWGFVDKGIFRFTSNGMYLFGFLFLWVPGLMLESSGALLAAAFSHTYIWVHYYCTEKPDMEYIYQ